MQCVWHQGKPAPFTQDGVQCGHHGACHQRDRIGVARLAGAVCRTLRKSIQLTLAACARSFWCIMCRLRRLLPSVNISRSLRVWRDCYLWAFPYYLLGAAMAGLASLASRYVGWQTAVLIVPLVYLIYRSYCIYLGRLDDEKNHAEEMAGLHLRTIEALGAGYRGQGQHDARPVAPHATDGDADRQGPGTVGRG